MLEAEVMIPIEDWMQTKKHLSAVTVTALAAQIEKRFLGIEHSDEEL